MPDDTAGIKEGLFDADVVAEYLLWTLNSRIKAESGMAECAPNRRELSCLSVLMIDLPYTDLLPLPADFQPTPDLQVLLDALASRLGLLRKGGEKDLDVAREWLIKSFREGKVGRWTLDELEYPVTRKVTEEDEVEALLEVPETVSEGEVEGKDTLDARVSKTVATFLAAQSARVHAAEEGKDSSLSQQKKRDNRQKSEEREAKWRAKGIPVGMNYKTAQKRGPARGPKRAGRQGKRR
jgi:hypothetical protein